MMSHFSRRLLTIAAVLVSLLILAVPVLAQDVTPPDPTNLAGVADYWVSWDTALKDDDDSAWTVATVGELWPDYRRFFWRGRT